MIFFLGPPGLMGLAMCRIQVAMKFGLPLACLSHQNSYRPYARKNRFLLLGSPSEN